jgi:thiol:disulfide interchange protein DsbD
MKKSCTFAVFSVLAFVPLSIAGSDSAFGATPQPVEWTLSASLQNHLPIKKGAAVTAHIHATIQPGWHVYAMDQKPGGPIAARIAVPPDQAFVLDGDIDQSAPIKVHDPNFDMETRFFKNEASFSVPLTAIKAGSPKLSIDVRYQACDDSICLPPTTAHLSTIVTH